MILLLLTVSCSKNQISGTIELTDEYKAMVYLVKPESFSQIAASYEGRVLDSASIGANGEFNFKNLPRNDKPELYYLVIQKKDEKFANQLENEEIASANYLPFVYRKGTELKFQSHVTTFQSQSKINGLNEFNDEILALAQKRNELYTHYLKNFTEIDESNLMAFEKARFDYQSELIQSAQNSHSIFVPALALRWASLSGDYERLPELVKMSCSKMKDLDAAHLFTNQVCELTADLPLSIGDNFPDYELPMLNGETQNLTQLLGEKLTLIDLWAAWCAPCRVENRKTLIPLWDAYHDQGLQIVAYSIDGGRNAWEKAIETDGAHRWLHASHLQGDDSPLFQQLKISTIPANYILDANGKILAKNLHGEELTEWIAEYYRK